MIIPRLRQGNQQGFTLIELLVVVAIIGILASIGINNFILYKQKTHNAAAQSDLRNAITAEEAVFAETEAYASCDGTEACEGALPGFVGTHSPQGANVMTVFRFVDGTTHFTGTAAHLNGTKTYTYDSDNGRIEEH